MRVRLLAAASLFALLAGCGADGHAGTLAVSTPAVAPSGLKLVPLQIRSGTRTHNFTVEVASTEEEQARGLMFRNSLAADAGMIFPFTPPRPAGFWMKNTLIPLDMIFVRSDGTIERIAANTIPHSLQSVESYGVVGAVLEIAGGRSAQLGIKEGDRVSWPGGPAAP